jgi:Zn-dependent peptidase ImmA (M78 family)
MRAGTPGFVGERLREAREVRSVSAVSLSEIAGVSAQAISQYEHNRSTPSPDVLDRIAAALNLPKAFFLLPERGESSAVSFFRSMSAATKAARRRAERRLEWLEDLYRYLAEYVAFPDPNLPVLDLPNDPLLISGSEIEQAALDLRNYWRLPQGPIANTVLLVENQGVVVGRDLLGAETLDGLSRVDQETERPFLLVGTDKGSPARWRFDVAHEIGHMILHSTIKPGLLRKSDQFKRIEQQAHHFARALLLPISSFGDDLFAVNLDTLRALKPKWKVSIAMMIMRARDGEMLSEDSERKLWINMSRRGWRTKEPGDDTMEPELPRLIPHAFELLLSDRIITPDDAVARLGLPIRDIEALSSLPAGYLESFSPVTLIGERPSDLGVNSSRGPGVVIELPKRRATS